ncbi:hypothetical protein J0H58_17495 [bacterium]|nr:hypothetical protein [bacterium]
MKLDKDTLKKHHFWILLGIVPVVVLVAVLAVTATVGAAIEAKNKAVGDAQKEIDGKQNVKSDPLIKVLDDQKGQLEVKRTELWKENWERQIGVTATTDKDGKVVEAKQDPNRNLLRWPRSQSLARFEYTPEYATSKTQLKFGDKIPSPNGDELSQFKVREVYLAEFTSPNKTGMADKVAPTTFLNGWQSVLRHISFPPVGTGGPSGWGERVPGSEQVWLALEDMWVQRAMLGQVKAVNDQLGAFERVPLLDANNRPVDAPLHRTFQSRIWRVELKVAEDEKDRTKKVLTGRIKNVTDRLQTFGAGSRMVLKVWVTGDPKGEPVPFEIGGEFLPGGAEREVVRDRKHDLPPGVNPTEIVRVEQVFDTRTVPVRRIDALTLGFRDSRHALMPLKMPKFELYEKEAEKAASDPSAGAGGSPGPGGPGSASGPPPGMAFPGPGRGHGSEGGVGGMAGAAGTVETVVEANRKRYVELTAQVRRMPVAITVVTDQAYIQDVLLAYANSPLRFQITQVHWKRFQGSLTGTGTGTGTGAEGGYGSPEGSVLISGAGTTGSGFLPGEGGGGGFSRGGFGSFSGPTGAGAGPGRGLPGPGSPIGIAPPLGMMPMGPGGSPMGPGGSPFGPGGTMTSVSESQLTAGLVELTIYGIVSLYEKYQAPAEPAAAP